MAELSLVPTHVFEKIEWIERLVVLEVELPIEMSIDLILRSLMDSFFSVHC